MLYMFMGPRVLLRVSGFLSSALIMYQGQKESFRSKTVVSPGGMSVGVRNKEKRDLCREREEHLTLGIIFNTGLNNDHNADQ